MIIQERMNLLFQYRQKGINRLDDLYVSINCIPIDCQPISKCSCGKHLCSEPEIPHFEIPQLYLDPDMKSIKYIGSPDKMNPFSVYTSPISLNNQKYKRRGKRKPIVFIDTTPNKNGFYDGFIFNAPLLEMLSITAVFKDPRQLSKFNCCNEALNETLNSLDQEIVEHLTEKIIRWYKQGAMPILPNNQEYAIG